MKTSFDADISVEYPQLKDDKIIYFDSAGRSVLPVSVEREGYEALRYSNSLILQFYNTTNGYFDGSENLILIT